MVNGLRGQVFSVDLLFSVVLLLFLLTTIVFISSEYARTVEENERNSELDYVANSVLSGLIQTSGSPSNWTVVSSVNSLGLASDRNVLSASKVEAFFSMDEGEYNESKAILGLNREARAYGFSARIVALNGTALHDLNKNAYGNDTAVVNGFALLDDSIVRMELSVWRR